MRQDERGLALSTENESAADIYNEAIKQYFEYRRSFGPLVKKAVEADEGFAMAHCLRGYMFMMFATTMVHDKAGKCLERAEALAGDATPRERAHIGALRAWHENDSVKANDIWEQILAEEPLDILALRLQHAGAFWMGQNYLLRDAVARVFPAWDESVPGFGHVEGMFAFGLEECGDYAPAERLGKDAVERNPEDLWAIHAVAHVLEMQGRLAEGEAWLDYPADAWEDRNPFRGHLWWHRALFLLDQSRHEEVLALYDRSIRTEKTEFYLDIQNQAALLMRLELQGIEVGNRWEELADQLETNLEDHVLPFTDLHTAMALASAGREAALQRFLDSLETFAEEKGHAAATARPFTIPICKALSAFRSRRPDETIEQLMPIRYDWRNCGGSHAQRDIIQQILLEAAIEARRWPLARALAAERVALKPQSRGNWVKHLQVLERMGETTALAKAKADMGQVLI